MNVEAVKRLERLYRAMQEAGLENYDIRLAAILAILATWEDLERGKLGQSDGYLLEKLLVVKIDVLTEAGFMEGTNPTALGSIRNLQMCVEERERRDRLS